MSKQLYPSKLSYLYADQFKADCELLESREIPFKTEGMTITLDDETVATELSLQAFTKDGDKISITNNEGELYGHTEPLDCPKKAAELLVAAKKESRSWYYVRHPATQLETDNE